MPNYAFRCEACKEEFDVILSMSQNHTLPKCPKCNANKHVKRVFKPVPIRFNARDFSTTYRG